MFDLLHPEIDAFPEEETDELFRLTVAAYGDDEPEDRQHLPHDLESIPPGPYLAAILESIDRSRLTGHDVSASCRPARRLVSHCQAAYHADISEVAHSWDPDGTDREPIPVEFAAEEIQAALHKTRRAAESELTVALDLRNRMPEVGQALHDGRIDLSQAKVFVSELESCIRH